MNVSIDAVAFLASLKAAQERFAKNVLHALQVTAEIAADYAKRTTLFRSRTGKLERSIGSKMMSGYKARAVATAPYARWVEDGTRPHIIRARNKKVLRFEQNGETRFARFVRHPGTHPRPFMQQARDKTEPIFERLCNEAVQRMFG